MADLDTNRAAGTISAEATDRPKPDEAQEHNVLSGVEVHVTTYGLLHRRGPLMADVAVDVRWHFRNPLHSDELRDRNGHHPEVREYVLATPGVRSLIAAGVVMVKAFAEGSQATAGRPVTVAVGCGGGRHRAPGIGAELAQQLRAAGALRVTVEDLDIDLPVVDHHEPDNWDTEPEHQHAGEPEPS